MSPKSSQEVEEQKAIVRAFLQRCRNWAQQRETPKRAERVADEPNAADAAKLHAWIAYDEFLDHTMEELADGTLDHWFRDGLESTSAPKGGQS